ncbi:hypothetical protein [Clostridium saccharoperbutylacetonicum]|uniref:hypothetical protein n=1 Tax=Clostridium saccharoperbutylacetonicum TaxID=36745 RepID=UPI0039E76FA1
MEDNVIDITSLNFVKNHKTGEIETTARTETLHFNKVIWDMLYRRFFDKNSVDGTTWNGLVLNNMILANHSGTEKC